MAQMKSGYLDDLLGIISKKDRFLVPYSTSHIGDIFANKNEDETQLKRIEEDFGFITTLTENNCLYNDGKQIILNTIDPKSLYQDRSEAEGLLDGFELDKLAQLFNAEGIPGIDDTFFTNFKSLPLDDEFTKALENPETREMVNKVFPDLACNPTFGGFFKSFGKMIQNLNETEDYENLRKITRDGLGINRDKIYNIENPFEFIGKIHSKYGFSWENIVDNTKHAPVWFNKISNEYLFLDMHGYQADKVRVKPNKRKETFKNTIEDGFHAAFASTCHFYITSDKKSIKKTKQVYERLGINTVVLKPQEFVVLHRNSLHLNIQIVEQLCKSVLDVVKTEKYEEAEVAGRIQRTYYLNFFIFDFFNRLTLFMGDDEHKPTFMLGRNSPTNSGGPYVFEVRFLIKKLNALFGVEDKEFGKVSDDNLRGQTWWGLVWKHSSYEFQLLSHNGYAQLHLNFE